MKRRLEVLESELNKLQSRLTCLSAEKDSLTAEIGNNTNKAVEESAMEILLRKSEGHSLKRIAAFYEFSSILC